MTTSHSNIRVTANTEFKPKKDAGSDYRDVPYILLEASNDFIDDKQTFELALENAEWLEMDGDDGDTLYVEDDATMKDYLQFVPANGSTGDSPSGTTPSGDTAKLEQDYLAAAKDLKEKADAYISAVSSVSSTELSQAKTDVNNAKTAYENAQTATSAAKKAYDDAVAVQGNIETLKKAYEDAYAETKTDIYALGSKDAASYPNPEDSSASAGEGMYASEADGDNVKSLYYVAADGSAITAADDDALKTALDAATDKNLIQLVKQQNLNILNMQQQ